MWKYIAQVEGMVCGMCEAHVNDAVRRAFPNVRKVHSSRSKGKTEFVSEVELDPEALKAAISATGYTVTDLQKAPWEKKGLFGR